MAICAEVFGGGRNAVVVNPIGKRFGADHHPKVSRESNRHS
jgi:hypothetical protein